MKTHLKLSLTDLRSVLALAAALASGSGFAMPARLPSLSRQVQKTSEVLFIPPFQISALAQWNPSASQVDGRIAFSGAAAEAIFDVLSGWSPGAERRPYDSLQPNSSGYTYVDGKEVSCIQTKTSLGRIESTYCAVSLNLERGWVAAGVVMFDRNEQNLDQILGQEGAMRAQLRHSAVESVRIEGTPVQSTAALTVTGSAAQQISAQLKSNSSALQRVLGTRINCSIKRCQLNLKLL